MADAPQMNGMYLVRVMSDEAMRVTDRPVGPEGQYATTEFRGGLEGALDHTSPFAICMEPGVDPDYMDIVHQFARQTGARVTVGKPSRWYERPGEERVMHIVNGQNSVPNTGYNGFFHIPE